MYENCFAITRDARAAPRYAYPMDNAPPPSSDEAQKEEARRQRAAVADYLVLALGDDAPRGSPPWWNYYYVGKYLGEERSRQLVQEALAVEAAGGMLVSNGSRKRSLGGVFFKLAKKKIGPRLWRYLQGRATLKIEQRAAPPAAG